MSSIRTSSQPTDSRSSLTNGKIRFEELPLVPHGEIVGKIVKFLERQLDDPNGVDILCAAQDYGMIFFLEITHYGSGCEDIEQIHKATGRFV